MLLLLTLTNTAVAVNYPPVPTDVDGYAQIDADILALPEELKALLDEKIRPIRSSSRRTEALHELLFREPGLDIRYDSQHTFTAAQVYQYRRGNCLSLAALAIAAARYVKLKAAFQSVEVPPNWQRRDSFYVVPGHVNALIYSHREKINIEFLQVYSETETAKFTSQKITDLQALAEYHNNLGMEYFDAGRMTAAQQHFEQAIALQPQLDFVWSNFGVLFKYQHQPERAEEMYRHALSLNRKNFSAMTNLYLLLSENKRFEEAEKIASKVARYNRKNPYHFSKLAELDLKTGRYREAKSKINKAIRIDNQVPEFYHLLGQANYYSGDYKNAVTAFNKAKELSTSSVDQERFSKKILYLSQHLR